MLTSCSVTFEWAAMPQDHTLDYASPAPRTPTARHRFGAACMRISLMVLAIELLAFLAMTSLLEAIIPRYHPSWEWLRAVDATLPPTWAIGAAFAITGGLSGKTLVVGGASCALLLHDSTDPLSGQGMMNPTLDYQTPTARPALQTRAASLLNTITWTLFTPSVLLAGSVFTVDPVNRHWLFRRTIQRDGPNIYGVQWSEFFHRPDRLCIWKPLELARRRSERCGFAPRPFGNVRPIDLRFERRKHWRSSAIPIRLKA